VWLSGSSAWTIPRPRTDLEVAGLLMGRPRRFDVEEVVAVAADLFWECGYQRVTLADLERATCLNRSSLYQAFGAKDGLFDAALALYIASFIAPRLAAMERPGAGPRDVIGFFLRAGEALSRRCRPGKTRLPVGQRHRRIHQPRVAARCTS
jgi:AcrR family transcriptional regulator